MRSREVAYLASLISLKSLVRIQPHATNSRLGTYQDQYLGNWSHAILGRIKEKPHFGEVFLFLHYTNLCSMHALANSKESSS